MKYPPFLLSIWLMVMPFTTNAQVLTCLRIANETAGATEYTFDLYLETVSGTSGPLYLGNADFRILFDQSLFTNPVPEKVLLASPPFGQQIGYCTLIPTSTDNGGLTDLFLRKSYFDNTSVIEQYGNEVVINLNGATPSDQNAFNTGVARIDGAVQTHRLGRFAITGYNGSGNPNLTWNLTGTLRTKVFTLGSSSPFLSEAATVSVCGVLPVEWLDFRATKEDETRVRLNWTTLTEVNNDFFAVEKHLPGEEFIEIGQVKSIGTSLSPQAYQFLDQSPMAAINYYRLRQVDLNGAYSYSNTVQVFMEGTGLMVYPNPTQTHLFFKVNGKIDGAMQVWLYDLNGRLVRTADWPISTGQTQSMDLSGLPEGVYLYQVKAGEHTWNGRILKD